MEDKLYKGDYTKGEVELLKDNQTEDIVYENRFCKFYNDEVRFPSGTYGRFLRLAMEGKGSVAVLPITEDGSMIFIKTFRHAARSWGYEVPKGYCNEKEPPIESAKRELKEETGLMSDNFEYLGLYHESPSTIQYGLHCFIARDCKKVTDLKLEESEAISGTIAIKTFEKLPNADYKDAITEMLISQYFLKTVQTEKLEME